MKRFATPVIAVLALVMMTASAGAEVDLGFKGAGVRLSFVSPSDIDGTIGFGGLVKLGTFAPQVEFDATIDYWSKSSDASFGGFSSSSSFRDIVIGARSIYVFAITNQPKIKPYAGGGLAFHIFNSSVDVNTPFGPQDVSDTSVKIGIDLIGGSAFTVGEKIDLTAELMYRIVSDVGQFVISGGVIFWFG